MSEPPIPVVKGRQLPPEQTEMLKNTRDYWRKVSSEHLVQAVGKLEDAAKQLIALTGTLQGIYFAVFAFSDLKQRADGILLAPLVLLPLGLWMASLYNATMVFLPRLPDEGRGPELEDMGVEARKDMREFYRKRVDLKRDYLHKAHRYLVWSLLAVMLLLLALLLLTEATPDSAEPLKVIIVTPTP